MEAIHNDSEMDTVLLRASVSHFPTAFEWRCSNSSECKGFSVRKGAERVFSRLTDSGLHCAIRGEKRLPGLADIKLLLLLTQHAQRNGNKPELFLRSKAFILQELGITNCPNNIDDLLDNLEYLTTLHFEYCDAHQPPKCTKYGLKESERKTLYAGPVLREFSIDSENRRVRVKLCKDWLQMNSSADRSQFALLDMSVVRKLKMPSEFNLYRYFCAFPRLLAGTGSHCRELSWWAHLCGFHDFKNPDVSQWKLRKKVERAIGAVGRAIGIEPTFSRRKGVGGVPKWELKVCTGSAQHVQDETEDAVSPEVRLPAINDIGVKSTPRHRVRLVA